MCAKATSRRSLWPRSPEEKGRKWVEVHPGLRNRHKVHRALGAVPQASSWLEGERTLLSWGVPSAKVGRGSPAETS